MLKIYFLDNIIDFSKIIKLKIYLGERHRTQNALIIFKKELPRVQWSQVQSIFLQLLCSAHLSRYRNVFSSVLLRYPSCRVTALNVFYTIENIFSGAQSNKCNKFFSVLEKKQF